MSGADAQGGNRKHIRVSTAMPLHFMLNLSLVSVLNHEE